MADRRARGTGSVRYHRPSGLWRATLPRRLDPSERPRYFPTHEEATAWLDAEVARMDDAAASAATVATDDITVLFYLLRWLDLISLSEDWSPRTLRAKMTHINLLGAVLDMPLKSVARLDLQAVVVAVQTEPAKPLPKPVKGVFQRRRKASPPYVHAMVGTWRRAFGDAVEDKLIDANPASKLALPPNRPQRRESWTPSEARVLVPSISGQRFEAVYALIFGCGLRISEVLALAWADVHMNDARAWIWQGDDDGEILPRVKGRVGKWVSLPAPVLAALRRQAERQTWGAVYVSEYKPGRRAGRWSVTRDLKKLARENGVRPMSPHAGRHAVGNVLGAGNIPLATISDILRHANRLTTANWYIESDDAGAAAASALLESLFSGREDEATG